MNRISMNWWNVSAILLSGIYNVDNIGSGSAQFPMGFPRFLHYYFVICIIATA